MCSACWSEEGEPAINTPAVREAAAAVEAVYNHSCVGGNLHIVLDDWNIEDDSLEFCRVQIERGDHGTEEERATERRCHDLMRALSVPERASALALYSGYWG
jgi:hypothetical protein